ncbi:hypothetical protein [Streptomyces sp. NPDC056524]|uniref:hypothetical protein n=1 Tax=Streptomyces sp. NPDC056524 TaxID=3345851 RepID=UPI00369164B3
MTVLSTFKRGDSRFYVDPLEDATLAGASMLDLSRDLEADVEDADAEMDPWDLTDN